MTAHRFTEGRMSAMPFEGISGGEWRLYGPGGRLILSAPVSKGRAIFKPPSTGLFIWTRTAEGEAVESGTIEVLPD